MATTPERSANATRHRRHLTVLLVLWCVLAALWYVPEPASWRGPHRGWEAVLVSGVVDKREEIAARAAPFVPHARWQGTATGDLAFLLHMPGAARPHAQAFTIDEWGFRNPAGTIDGNRELAVVGNSFAVGSAVDDDENVTARLRAQGIAATNCGGIDLQGHVRDPRWREDPPKWVVHYVDEHALQPVVLSETLPPLALRSFASRAEYEDWIEAQVAARRQQAPAKPQAKPDRPFAWLPSNDAQRELKAWLDGRQTMLQAVFEPTVPLAADALGMPGLYDDALLHHDRASGQLFYRETGERYLALDRLLTGVDIVAATYAQVAGMLQKRGSRLIVLICPNKESVYHDRIPALAEIDTGVVLRALSQRLDALGIANVDAWSLCRDLRREHPEHELFVPDDTHPSPFLQARLADAIARIVRGG